VKVARSAASFTSLGRVILIALLLWPAAALAQETDERGGVGVRATLLLVSLGLRRYPVLEPGGRLGFRVPPSQVSQSWARDVRAFIDQVRTASRRVRLLTQLGSLSQRAGRGDRRILDIAAPRAPGGWPRGNLGRLVGLGRVVDLGVRMDTRVELRFDRLKNERCTAFDLGLSVAGCQGGFPAPSLDQQFRVGAGGIVSQRVNLNVDFDSEREFNSNNDIRIWYQGLEDEIIRRVEVGNVSFSVPASRFITSAVPAKSFGFKVEAQVGPLELRTIFAQQSGSSVRSRVFTVGDELTQAVDRETRDLDYEAGRFFSVVKPSLIPGYPDIDIFSLLLADLPPDLRMAEVRVYRVRSQSGQSGSNANLGGIQAVAVRRDSDQRVGPLPWEILVEGSDYYIDPSGLWFAMATRVGDRDFLAVSYVTTAGDTVGTFPAVDEGLDTLELIYEPRRGPEVPTFEHELRNVYRLGGNDIDRSTIEFSIVVNESDQPLDQQGTYLSRLGLARTTDQNTLDEFNRVFPRLRDPGGGLPIRDLFVVFPHLKPFADSTRLLGGERNDSLYLTPTHLRFTQGPPSTFVMQMHMQTVGVGSRSELSLGALQLQPGSERIRIGGRELVRGVDYEISYDIGSVTFLNPDSLFVGPTQVTVEFEENQLFDIAPKSVIGLATTYTLGTYGRIDAIGLMQKERSQLNRPRLGFEPRATLIGGLSTALNFQPDGITRFLNGLPLIQTSVPSRLVISGELAVSQPNPNQAGQAYIEDFESPGASTRAISMAENGFQLGSKPESGEGLDASLLAPGGFFDELDAVPLVWQNLIPAGGGTALTITPQDIDSTIVLTGTVRQTESILWLTLKPDTVGGAPDAVTGNPRWIRPHTAGPRWRSMSKPLSASGVGEDLSRVEFIEFWVLEDEDRAAREAGAHLVLDFGTVFEDAVAIAPDSFAVVGSDTIFSGLQFAGAGVLDSEKDSITGVFNAVRDDIGIHADRLPRVVNIETGDVITDLGMCRGRTGSAVPVFPLGDLGARCTRFNGLIDTEDLDGDNRLDVTVGKIQENYFRYVFPIGGEQFYVRDGGSIPSASGGILRWRLYRISFQADNVPVGQPNMRQIESFRLTFVAPAAVEEKDLFIALARFRLLGAPWLKRASTPIAGIAGLRGEAHGGVIASVVSTENRDLGYTSPPGVTNQAAQAGTGFAFGSIQINEKSLRLLATDLRTGERAEAFQRFFDEADKNFLRYRTLKIWARGRGAGWAEGDLEFYVKVGRDEDNFYMYRTPVNTDTWEPEIVIEIQRWLSLRAEAESRWLRGEQPSGSAECGGNETAFVVCSGPYIVHVGNPGISPPNLARVSEVAVGILRVSDGTFVDQAELWVDDIRLDDVIGDAGLASAINIQLSAADVAEINYSFTSVDDRFQLPGETPNYIGNRESRFSSSFRVDKLMPVSWGMSIPISVQIRNARENPFFLNRSDVLGEEISGLRSPNSRSSTYQMSLRRLRRGESFLARNLLDPFSLFALAQESESVQLLSEAETSNRQFRVRYNRLADAMTVRAAPGFVLKLLNLMPLFIRGSEFGKSLRTSRLRWNPVQVNVTSQITNNRSERTSFRVPVALARDTVIRPTRSINHTWTNTGSIDLRPMSTFNVRASYSSLRDLQDYGDSTTLGRLLASERRNVAGTEVGFERSRTLSTNVNLRPVVSSWLSPRIIVATTYSFNRDPNNPNPVRETGDSIGGFKVAESVRNSRNREFGSRFDFRRLVAGIFGDSSALAALVRGVAPLDLSYLIQRTSAFDRVPFRTGLRYQLALGKLDEFRSHNGVLATSATESKTWTVTGGTRLPFGMRVNLNYRRGTSETFTKRGDAQIQIRQSNTEWPSLRFDWTLSPRGSVRRVLSGISARAAYRKNETSTVQPGFASLGGEGGGPGAGVSLAQTGRESTTLTPSLTLTWGGGITTQAQFSQVRSEALNSGNLTITDQVGWLGSLSFSLRVPRSVARLPSPILATVSFTTNKSTVCLLKRDEPECLAISDSRRSQIAVNLDTGFSPTVRGGVSFSRLITEQLHNSSKTSQTVFTIFAQVNFTAGQIQ